MTSLRPNAGQLFVLTVCAVLIATTLAFPPIQVVHRYGEIEGLGHWWTFSHPYGSTVNVRLLLTEWLGIGLVGALGCFILQFIRWDAVLGTRVWQSKVPRGGENTHASPGDGATAKPLLSAPLTLMPRQGLEPAPIMSPTLPSAAPEPKASPVRVAARWAGLVFLAMWLPVVWVWWGNLKVIFLKSVPMSIYAVAVFLIVWAVQALRTRSIRGKGKIAEGAGRAPRLQA